MFDWMALDKVSISSPIDKSFASSGIQMISAPVVPDISTMAVCGNCSMRLLTMLRANSPSWVNFIPAFGKLPSFPTPSFFNDKSR